MMAMAKVFLCGVLGGAVIAPIAISYGLTNDVPMYELCEKDYIDDPCEIQVWTSMCMSTKGRTDEAIVAMAKAHALRRRIQTSRVEIRVYRSAFQYRMPFTSHWNCIYHDIFAKVGRPDENGAQTYVDTDGAVYVPA